MSNRIQRHRQRQGRPLHGFVPSPPFETPAGFLTDRRAYFDIDVVPALSGAEGWDIVLRIDGTYFYGTKSEVEPMANVMRDWLTGLADLPHDGWSAWGRHEDSTRTGRS